MKIRSQILTLSVQQKRKKGPRHPPPKEEDAILISRRASNRREESDLAASQEKGPIFPFMIALRGLARVTRSTPCHLTEKGKKLQGKTIWRSQGLPIREGGLIRSTERLVKKRAFRKYRRKRKGRRAKKRTALHERSG